MELLSVSLRLFWSFLLHSTLLFCLSQRSRSATVPTNETDRLALLAFKDRITKDPLNVMSSWNHSLHFCEWRGITCSLRHERVTVLNLTSFELEGSKSPTNIVIDVAYALDYLQHHCQTPISHCDLKPSNVLLDNDMVAHVSDFGIARFLSVAVDDNSMSKTNSIAAKGSVGYVAPEYGMGGNVSTSGDVYSYGILLLEMFTGKRPTEDMFKDGLNLHEFVKMALPDQVLEIADLRLLEEQKEEQEQDQEIAFSHIRSREVKRGSVFGCLVSFFGIGVACSVESPRERMQMKDVVNKMHMIRDMFLGAGIYREGRNKTIR